MTEFESENKDKGRFVPLCPANRKSQLLKTGGKDKQQMDVAANYHLDNHPAWQLTTYNVLLLQLQEVRHFYNRQPTVTRRDFHLQCTLCTITQDKFMQGDGKDAQQGKAAPDM